MNAEMNTIKIKDKEFKPVRIDEVSSLTDICASCDIRGLDICGIVDCAIFEEELQHFVYTEVNN